MSRLIRRPTFRTRYGHGTDVFDLDGDGAERDEVWSPDRMLKLMDPNVDFSSFDAPKHLVECQLRGVRQLRGVSEGVR